MMYVDMLSLSFIKIDRWGQILLFHTKVPLRRRTGQMQQLENDNLQNGGCVAQIIQVCVFTPYLNVHQSHSAG